MIDANSRYSGSGTAMLIAPDGSYIPYLKRRLLPQGDRMEILMVTTVGDGQRLDLLSAKLQGDPLQFWRIADANNAMNPFDLGRPGQHLRIPKPGQ